MEVYKNDSTEEALAVAGKDRAMNIADRLHQAAAYPDNSNKMRTGRVSRRRVHDISGFQTGTGQSAKQALRGINSPPGPYIFAHITLAQPMRATNTTHANMSALFT